MPTGGFIGYAPAVRGSVGPANSILITGLVAQRSGTATAVLLDGASATPSTTFKAVVYDGAHSALLATSNTATAIAANYNRFALTTALGITAGTTYYVGYVSGAAGTLSVHAGGTAPTWFVSGGQSVASPANPLVGGASNTNVLMVALELDGASSSGFGFSLDQSVGVTLSASNTQATFSTISNGARSIVTQLAGTGKWYAEIVAGGTLNATNAIGLASANWGVTQRAGQLSYVRFLLPSGTLQGNAGTTALGLTFVSGDVIGIAWDAGGNLLWFNKNNGAWFGASSTAGNPVTGTGGSTTPAVGWPWTIAVATGGTSSAAVFTLRDTAGALQYTPPAGFSSWSAATYSPGTPLLRRRVMVVG